MIHEEVFDLQEDFQLTSSSRKLHNLGANQQPDLTHFQQVIFALQQVIIEDQFQNKQTGFMRTHCFAISANSQCKGQTLSTFQKYCTQISNCLSQTMTQKIANFNLFDFLPQAKERKEEIDLQIYEILMSLSDFQIFKQILLDYREAHEQQERYKILTIKTNKIPENKKVKSHTENIFASSNENLFPNKPIMTKNNKKQTKEKTEDQLLVQEKVLTVKGLRKC